MTTFAVTTGRKLSILIASEREMLTRAMAETLRAQGHDIVIQETGPGVAEALGAQTVDAIVLDPDLPGLDYDRLRGAFNQDRASVPESIDAIERRHIAATLRFTGGNRRNAAQLLGIARSTLLAKIRKYGLDRE
jgi:DNA-binding NtrC family response regulator